MIRGKKLHFTAAFALLLLIVGAVLYGRYVSPTKIATLNFPDFTTEKFIRSNNNPFVKIESVALDEADKISRYDMVLVRVHGSSMDANHMAAIQNAIKKGVAVFATESDNPQINSLRGRELEYVAALVENGSVKNYQILFNYIRTNIDRKVVSNGTYTEPLIVPEDYYFHLGDDNFFAELRDYQRFYEQTGRYREGAPRVVVLSGNINMQNSNEEHIAAIINSLEAKGMNVYPINSFGIKKLSMIEAVRPNLIINRPHGRLVMGGGDSGTDMLERLNVPMLAPITVSELHEHWLADKQGMASGGMTSMSVVMPELDGAIAPFTVAAQFERGGMHIFDAIPGHTERFCRMVENFTKLQIKPNAQKKVAIYYYKGTGKGSVNAADIEGVQSLYNTLKLLSHSGYNVSELPASASDLEQMIQRQGSVLGAYAHGAYDEFMRNGNPELVEVGTFEQWAAKSLPTKLIDDMRTQYGAAPGKYMSYEQGGKQYIAVARIEFGNVAILPQPMPSEGDDIEKITHGVAGAPAYPYVASYLWTRHGFGADAMIHFGTHGNLEFIPGKQIALSDNDWSDVLVGDLPHFYIYTTNNIGEGIIAKRRSYATLISHLTAPFMQGELYDDFKQIENHLYKAESLEHSAIRDEHITSLKELCRRQNIFAALGIDSTRTLSVDDLASIHNYMEQIDGAKVTDGLYTLGEPYSPQEIANTTRLMSIDPIRYSLARIDVVHGRIGADKLDNLTFMEQHYGQRANSIITTLLQGKGGDVTFRSLVSPSDIKLLEAHTQAQSAQAAVMEQMMRMAGNSKAKTIAPFFDSEGNMIDAQKRISDMSAKQKMALAKSMMKDDPQAQKLSGLERMGYAIKVLDKLEEQEQNGTLQLPAIEVDKSEPSMMERMAQATPVSLDSDSANTRKPLVEALEALRTAIEGVAQIKSNLLHSTAIEQQALLNALNGGYVTTGSAGDPIVNPRAVPTGRNFYAINPETTPTAEAWQVGRQLADNLLEQELAANGKYPQKVSFTLWSTDFISSEGATVAQILWMLGVEPLRDGFGYIRSLQLVPAAKLGRPRIDVVVQTSGQLRDIAASRLELINRAVAMAAADKTAENYVRKGFEDAEKLLLNKGFSPADARRFSQERIFGGAGGNYGTGIMGMVEKGDNWESTDQIASQYIQNMGALYSTNGSQAWGEMRDGVFEAALLNTSVVVQPRSSNTWGPLSLDHVYEFMGGMSAAVQQVTGNDPTAYFNDLRNSSRAKVQGLKEAIGVETNSTIFNPKYITQKLAGKASAMNSFAETVRNTFGWNAMKPSAIDQHIWNQYHEVYVRDSHKLGIEKSFANKNPFALQELTAVMLESARKGMWQASPQQLREVADLHTRMVANHKAGCSGFICDNTKLQQFIAQSADPANAQRYKAAISTAREVQITQQQADNSVVLRKEAQNNTPHTSNNESDQPTNYTLFYVLGALMVALVGWVVYRRTTR